MDESLSPTGKSDAPSFHCLTLPGFWDITRAFSRRDGETANHPTISPVAGSNQGEEKELMTIGLMARSLIESPTMKLNEQARRMRDRGQPVIHLGIGEPKSKTPIDAIRGATAKLMTADVHYTPTDGTPELKQAIIRYMEDHYGRMLAPEQLIASGGAKQSLAVLFQTILNPQDEVIITAPYWVSYPEMVKMAYGVPVIVKPEDGRFQPRMQDIADAVTSYTKAIVVNNPNNPSGEVYDEAFIREIVSFCETKGLWLIMDDIYHRLVYDGKPWLPAYRFTDKDVDDSRIVVVNGISKLYAMTGFRIGWVAGPRKLVQAMITVQGHGSSCPPAVSQSAAASALNGMQSTVDNLRLKLQNLRDVLVTELNGFDGVRVKKPDGALYVLADFRAYSNNSMELAQFLLDKVMVVTVPGAAFGMEGFLRLSFCKTVKELTEGVARMKWALDTNSPNEIFINDRKLVRDWV